MESGSHDVRSSFWNLRQCDSSICCWSRINIKVISNTNGLPARDEFRKHALVQLCPDIGSVKRSFHGSQWPLRVAVVHLAPSRIAILSSSEVPQFAGCLNFCSKASGLCNRIPHSHKTSADIKHNNSGNELDLPNEHQRPDPIVQLDNVARKSLC